MNKIGAFPFIIFCLFQLACPRNPLDKPIPPSPLDRRPQSEADCASAEKNLLHLGCRDANGRIIGGPNGRGDAFHAVCENAMANKYDINPSCLAQIKSCMEIASCSR